jgi:hypothetical protein
MSQSTTGVQTTTAIDQQVNVDTDSGRVMVVFSFHNRSSGTVYVPRWLARAQRLGNEEFEVTRDGGRVPYIGTLIKRAVPTEKDFVALAPGESLTNQIDITDDYAFPAGKHLYRLKLYGNYVDPRTRRRVTANTAEASFLFEAK